MESSLCFYSDCDMRVPEEGGSYCIYEEDNYVCKLSSGVCPCMEPTESIDFLEEDE